MELYFVATGEDKQLDWFEKQLGTIRMQLPFEKDGVKGLQPVYGNLQPIKLYRYVFPRNHLDCVLKTLGLPDDRYKKFDKQSFALRKIMKAEKIPTPTTDVKAVDIDRENIGIIGIGIKKDCDFIDDQGYKREAI